MSLIIDFPFYSSYPGKCHSLEEAPFLCKFHVMALPQQQQKPELILEKYFKTVIPNLRYQDTY